jgi:hypothetical protein
LAPETVLPYRMKVGGREEEEGYFPLLFCC